MTDRKLVVTISDRSNAGRREIDSRVYVVAGKLAALLKGKHRRRCSEAEIQALREWEEIRRVERLR